MEPITKTKDLEKACAALSGGGYITVDTEFMREQTFWPKLCLLQFAGPDGAYLVDPLAGGLNLAPFYGLLADRSVVKVFHAARQDIEIFHHEGGIIPDPLFDTQIAAMVCGFGDSVGYETLVRRLANGSIDKSSRFTDWSRRPLSKKQLAYALADVTHLRDVYTKLTKQLSKSKRGQWVAEEMAVLQDPRTYEMKPENAWKRLKMRIKGPKALAVLIEVAAWREREAQSRDVPRNRIIKDDAIYEIAQQAPETPKDLERLRAVPKGFSRSAQAKSLLEAVHRGIAADFDRLPVIDRAPPLPSGLGPLTDLLKVLLKQVSEEHDVAQKLIANVADLERIAADDFADVPALKGWRRELFGERALDLKHGRLALVANGRRVHTVELPQEATAAAAGE